MRTITESESTPKADGFFMPAEFAPQDRVWMGWPHRTDTWAHGAKPAQKQYAAIARAIATKARMVIMDEPTTALTQREVDNLIRVINGLRASGVAVLFVSHKLDECYAIGGQAIVHRAGLGAGAAMGLVNLHILAGGLFVVRHKGRVVVFVKLARHVVRGVEQRRLRRHHTTDRQRRSQQKGFEFQGGHTRVAQKA